MLSVISDILMISLTFGPTVTIEYWTKISGEDLKLQ